MNRPTRDTPAGRAYLDLQNRARKEHRGTQELLTMYVVERWLARLSRSPHANDVVLKGGMLLAAFGIRRPTVDADALARNMPDDQRAVAQLVTDVATLADPDDGVQFLSETITTTIIRDDALYSGVRVTMNALLATAQVKLHLDINFGDPITPAPHTIDLPALRPDTPPIRLLGYPIETVLAEKLVTAIDLADANTRVRDYADIYALTNTHPLRCDLIRTAITATATFRGVTLTPLAQAARRIGTLRATTYTAYRNRIGASSTGLPEQFSDTAAAAAAFIDPVLEGLDDAAVWDPAARRWAAGR